MMVIIKCYPELSVTAEYPVSNNSDKVLECVLQARYQTATAVSASLNMLQSDGACESWTHKRANTLTHRRAELYCLLGGCLTVQI